MITYHHIGGRNGTFPLPLKNGPLLNDFHLILYDADENCFEQMQNAGHNEWGKVNVFPFCIGAQTGSSAFHLNFHPTTNSLYPFNDEFKDYNLVNNALYGEYVFGDACQHIRSVELNLLSLEDALATSKISSIDFLSLDVQGAEYDILIGAKQLLEKQCVGIQLEVEFVKLYQNQKTFSDINELMESMGFELLDLGSFGRCAPMSLPIGFRGAEQPLYAEAVYVKKFNTLKESNDIDFLCKCAFFCLIYKKTGMCLKFLNRVSELTNLSSYQNPTNSLHIKCLVEMWKLFEEFQHIRLPKLSQLFSHEKFQNYYGQKKNTVSDNAEYNTLIQSMKKMLPIVKDFTSATSAPFEELLQKYGLDDVASAVREKRHHEAKCFLELVK